MNGQKMIEYFKKRWGVHSALQVAIIMVVFACTGFTALYIKKPIYQVLGVDPDWHWSVRTLIWMVTIFPTYNLFLLIYGFIFGQFRFFLNFEKRMLYRLTGQKHKLKSIDMGDDQAT